MNPTTDAERSLKRMGHAINIMGFGVILMGLVPIAGIFFPETETETAPYAPVQYVPTAPIAVNPGPNAHRCHLTHPALGRPLCPSLTQETPK